MARYNVYVEDVSVEAVFNKLGGVEGAKRYLRDELTLVEKVLSFLTFTSKLIVNYNRTITELMKAGKYNWTNGDITDKNFPSSEKGEKEVEFGMFNFNKGMSSEDVITQMKKDGFRPATMKELLSYGEKNPEEQRKYPIIGLGSVALSGNERVGCLFGSGDGGRRADLFYFCDFGDYYRFLAVCN